MSDLSGAELDASKITSDIIFSSTPPAAGYWELVPQPFGVRYESHHRPRWFHRTMIRLCFGWKWVDAKEQK